jgi:type IV pilus assembly protein PilX
MSRKDIDVLSHHSKRLVEPRFKHPQQGFVLLIALIFLLLMSVLAFSASQHSLLQERIAGSFRNAQQARMSAETALRGAEYKLWSTATQVGAHIHCTNGAISGDDGCVVYQPLSAPYGANGAVTQFQSAQRWLTNIGVTYDGPTHKGYTSEQGELTAVLARNPVYIIEDLGTERPPGVGGLHESGNTGSNNDSANQLDIHVFRITARGTGGNPNMLSVVQSTFDAPVTD